MLGRDRTADTVAGAETHTALHRKVVDLTGTASCFHVGEKIRCKLLDDVTKLLRYVPVSPAARTTAAAKTTTASIFVLNLLGTERHDAD